MTEKETDKLLNQFLKEHKQELPDNGFSHKVTRNLPGREKRLSTIWMGICSIVAIILFFIFDGISALSTIVIRIFTTVGGSLLEIEPLYLYIALLVLIVLGMQKLLSFE